MTARTPKDLNGDGKIDKREIIASNLGPSAVSTEGQEEKVKHGTSINQARVSSHYLDMFEHDEGEVIAYEIRKHPIGLVVIWGLTFLFIILVWAMVVSLAWFRSDVTATLNGNDVTTAGIVIGGGLTVLALLFGYIAAFLYTNNLLIVTSEKLVQIRYLSLFNRKVSSLSIGDVQDVSAYQNGIFPMLFGYGTLVIETAGEQNNYNFTIAKDANTCAKTIVELHEKNLHTYGN